MSARDEEVKELIAKVAEENPEAIRFATLDAAIVGIARQHAGLSPVLCYSERGILNALKKQFRRCPDPTESAREWYDYNIACLAVGAGTPVIITDEV